MESIFIEKINQEIKKDFLYPFETDEGIFFIEIIARAKSWWQNLKGLKSFLKDDDITLNLDNIKIFTSNSNDRDVKAIWNGNELRGLSKTVLIAIKLKKGKHLLIFKPDKSPVLESIKIMELEEKDNNTIIYYPSDNNPPEKGDRRPWISWVLVDLAVKELGVLAKADKHGRDDEDIKLLINGKIEKNEDKKSHKDWLWCGKVLNGREKEVIKALNLEKGTHSIELWADNSPCLKKIEVTVLVDDCGVRWLYHKAQGSTSDKKRYWKSWREAVMGYGPGEQEYVDSVWDIYKKGIKNDKKLGIIRLWSIILIMMLPLFFSGGVAYSLDNKIKGQIASGESEQIEEIDLTYSQDGDYFLAQVEFEEDWWEEFRVGRLVKENIHWLTVDKPMNGPFGEQAILSARFVSLKGFVNPIVEVYGLTHAGHGYLYIYEIENDALKLLFETPAVDYNTDTRWAPDNYKKYGHGTCGEIFAGGKLMSAYGDINKDGSLDLVLSGEQEIICESEDRSNGIQELKLAVIPVKRIFLWDSDARVWSEFIY